jgi:hypothetical protein
MTDLLKVFTETSFDTMFVIAGLAFLLISVVGNITGKIKPGKGGRIAAGVLGPVLIIAGLAIHSQHGTSSATQQEVSEQSEQVTSKPTNESKTRQGLASSHKLETAKEESSSKPVESGSEPVEKSSKPVLQVAGAWHNGPDHFVLFETGSSIKSEGSYGPANGHVTGPRTFQMSWATGTFDGTVEGDRITWSNNTSWTRERNVNGTWRNGNDTFVLSQSAESIVSDGSYGHTLGRFTGPDTLSMAWQNGTLNATVQGNMMHWSNGTTWQRVKAANLN